VTMIQCIISAALLLASTASVAAIAVAPDTPLSNQTVRIRLVNQYFSQTSIESATIERVGNQFTIHQSVIESCFLPSAPTLTSSFDVGVLPAGTYQIVATIRNTRPCGDYTANETAGFVVFDPVEIPVDRPLALFVLCVLLGLVGLRHLGARAST
jgi:hypothetical protein